MDIYKHNKILRLMKKPKEIENISEWLNQKDFFDFLQDEVNDEYIILYASLPRLFMHSVFIPKTKINEEIIEDLLGWSFNPYNQWSYLASKEDVWVEGPLYGCGSKLISRGEQIIFARSFEGVPTRRQYYELNQKISQVLELHYMQERNAWCKLDNSGDIWDAIKIIKLNILPDDFSNNIIYANKQLLGEYAAVNDYLLFRMFDFTRVTKDFLVWKGDRARISIPNNGGIYGHLTIVDNIVSNSRGFQIADIAIPKEKLIDRIFGRDSQEDKVYETFIADDWRHGEITEISCNPSCLASYYDDSNLPYETTPAFFNREVLLKYKGDREKYTIDDTTISCRGTWYLQSFDINEEGQVSVYLCDLGNLPHKEQLHWKQYNEKPKGLISEKAFRRDFLAQFDDSYDPLLSIKRKFSELHRKQVKWWKLRSREVLEKVQYPRTDSVNEWEDELLYLHQLIIEGLEEKYLREKADNLGLNLEAKFGSLKLMEKSLVGFGFDEDRAYKVMSPFHDLNNHRKKLKAHVSGKEAMELRKKAIEEFGSYYGHFANLCKEIDESLELIISAFDVQ